MLALSSARSAPQAVSKRTCRRLEQGKGILWFVNRARALAPEFEFYGLPKQSAFPLLMRKRAAFQCPDPKEEGEEGRAPKKRNWVPLQVRNTNSTRGIAAKEMTSTGVPRGSKEEEIHGAREMPHSINFVNSKYFYELRNPSHDRYPDLPLLVTSIATNSICITDSSPVAHANKFVRLKLDSDDIINLDGAAASHQLRERLEGLLLSSSQDSCFESRVRSAASLPESMATAISAASASSHLQWIRTSATSTALLHNRILLLQLMQLPVFAEMCFPPTILVAHHNAELRQRRVLFRASTWTKGGTGYYSRHVRFHLYKMTKGMARTPFTTSDEIDVFLFLTADDRNDKLRLTRVGMIPKAKMLENGLLGNDGDGSIGKILHYLPCQRADNDADTKSNNSNFGRTFQNLDSYFISVTKSKDEISQFASRVLIESQNDENEQERKNQAQCAAQSICHTRAVVRCQI
ncbi:unnamed protein product [Amoebophrya sp. A120]|nr:unnamed protein product [Amoebophrya sp. A120]|eukprot:GSA120T00008749001.1